MSNSPNKEEKARRRGKVYNWETAMYGKIWYDEDVHDLISVETEFPAIVLNDALTSEVTLSCEPTVIDFRISFDESDDEDYTMALPSCDYETLGPAKLTNFLDHDTNFSELGPEARCCRSPQLSLCLYKEFINFMLGISNKALWANMALFIRPILVWYLTFDVHREALPDDRGIRHHRMLSIVHKFNPRDLTCPPTKACLMLALEGFPSINREYFRITQMFWQYHEDNAKDS
ncbi:hypothetical protein Tco_0852275 [Tanacetum coccineum]